jgi:hypothetical protein
MRPYLRAVTAASILALSACGGGGDADGGATGTSAEAPSVSTSEPAAPPVKVAGVLQPATWKMSCRGGFETPTSLTPAWMATYGYRVTISIDRQIDADHADATVTFSDAAGAHCDEVAPLSKHAVVRTYRLTRIGQQMVQGVMGEQIEATLLSEKRTGQAEVSPDTLCVAPHELPHRVVPCELPKLPTLERTVFAISGDTLLTGFHVRGIRPDAGATATYENAAGLELEFDPFVTYRRERSGS